MFDGMSPLQLTDFSANAAVIFSNVFAKSESV